MNAKELIDKLELLPHPEGGYYKETYRSSELVLNNEGNERSVCTSIYFLLEDLNVSHFHRIKSDEHWYFHMGQPIEIYYFQKNELKIVILGNNIEKGELPYFKVPSNTWFASKIKDGIGYCLVSCVVAPGFDFKDFELAQRKEMLEKYPQYKNDIKTLLLD